jgi:hypothetical protein
MNDLTTLESASDARKYINAARTPTERNRRKRLLFAFTFGASSAKLSQIDNEPTPETKWHARS